MSSAQQVLPLQTPIPAGRARRPAGISPARFGHRPGQSLSSFPTRSVFVAFHPPTPSVRLMDGQPAEALTLLFSDPRYIDTLVNTLLFVCIGVR